MAEQLQLGEEVEPLPEGERATVWTFTVIGQVVPWQRTSSSTYSPRFTPKRTRDYQRDVATIAAIRRPPGWPYRDKHMEFALTLHLFHKDRRRRDNDNCQKTIKDALNGIAYLDDYLVAEDHVFRSLDRENPRVEIELRLLP